ncbi:MAG: DUF1330 domain-containing protein [SAR86 cluster bacterium]|uniref:DUF1330 domain-containing protein n=1 Tax=SAR86 cluster bacterium TaxID=2030880 RepID=A0A2A5AW61_9GAMM|nr:MAG: DUF1330 domain-containing protein [SAR86 cluster bacterium]
MIYLTQLIYIIEGQEGALDEFESIAIPIIRKHNGELVLRIRPGKDSLIEGIAELPYEVHIVSFPSQKDFDNFAIDEERKASIHLKEKAIRDVVLYQGVLL